MGKTELQKAVEHLEFRHGGLRAAARALDVDPGYLSRLKSGEKTNPSDKILRKLWLKRTTKVTYEHLAKSLADSL